MPSSRLTFDDESLPQPRPSRWRALWRLSFVVVFAAWSLLLLAWLTLHWGILPNVRTWLPQIEQQASRALGTTVRIGDIRVRSGGWVPVVELDDVVLLDPSRREVLRLPSVVAAPAARSLPALELRLQQLVIDGAELEVRRDARGTIRVAGYVLDGDASAGDDRFAEWLFRQREVVVRGARLRWVDEQRAGGPLELQAVDLVVRNGVRSRDFRLDATPPAGWGERFSLLGRFTTPLLGGGSEWRRWSGSLHADLPRVDVEQLRRHVSLPFELNGGGGALRAWVDLVQGEASAMTVDVALVSVALRLADDLEPLVLQQVQGRLAARRDVDSTTWSATDLGFTDGDGRHWPAGDLSLTLRRHGDDRVRGPAKGGEFRAERLDLALMASVAERLPLGAAARGLLDDLQPAGIVEPLQARWDGPLDAPTHYRVQATVRDLATAARPSPEPGGLGRPGWRGAAIEIDAHEHGGRAQLSIEDGTLVLPGVFEQPAVPLEDFSAGLAWRVQPRAEGAPPDIELQISGARFGNADARGSFDAVWRSGQGAGFARGGRFPGRLELRGRLDEADAQAVARYLPLGLPEATRRYIERAVRGGRLSGGRFRVEGDLWDFPFAGPERGTFRITGRAEGVDFAYVPDEPGWTSPWPAFTAVSGDLEFDRVSMAVRNGTARVYGVEVSGVTATIADMVEAPVLELDGLAQGPVNDLLRFLAASPVGGWLGDALAQATAEGRGRLQLSIGVPLDHLERSAVRGVLRLDGNGLQLAPDAPPLADARGEVEFTDAGFVLRNVRGRVLGGEAAIEGGLQAEGGLQVTARGRASAEALRTQTQWPALAAVARVLRGEAAFRLKLDWAGDPTVEPAVDLVSDLVGMAIDLPAPIGKAADTALPLHGSITPLPSPDAPARGRDELQMTLGTRAELRYRREFDGDRVRVLGGGIGIAAPAPRPDVGVAAVATLEQLDVGAWRAAIERLAPDAPAGGSDYVPQRIDLRVGELRAEGRRLSAVVASASKASAGAPWRATVEADQLAGTVEWQPGGDAAAPGGVRARLSRLYLPPADSGQAEAWLGRPPSAVPGLDIVVDDFAVGTRSLGRLEVEAVNVPLGGTSGAHEWRLARLDLENPQASLRASGRWRPASELVPARMATDFHLDLRDAGGLLARLGMPDALRGGTGEMRGEVSWRGSPLAPHAPSMNGTLQLALRSGKFLQADSGAARVLSVLSLQALPRRLTLDFRDVFEEGFEFDEASGDVTITEGVARTNNLRMRGLQAGVLMEGQADLAKETQDLRVIVVPEINAGTASLLYSIINPMVGLGTFVAQLFLRQPLMAAGTREFHISGSWEDPKVERVERAAATPPPNPAQ